jgi:putative ABC transport system permease protein
VAVLGSVVRDQLFGADVNPVGEVIRINNQPFTVSGVMASKGQSGMGQDQDDVVFVPYTTVMKKMRGITFIQQVTVSAASAGDTSATADRIATLLRTRHKIQPGDPDDFMVRTMEEMASVRVQATQTMTSLLAGIAGVSLLVGGIGIMNIMLVSVTERTREIGIRMALGARRRRILSQFVVESIALSLLGGVLGVLLGAGLAVAAREVYGVPASIPAWAVLLSLASASGCGLVFGIYPAARASRLDPVEAMRTE